MYVTVKELSWALGVPGYKIRKWLRSNVAGDPLKHEWKLSKKDALRVVRHFVRGK